MKGKRMEKEKNDYEPVDPIEWAETYTFEEFIKLIRTRIENDPIFLNEARTLKATIADGNYTLQEGIDYETFYYRGRGKAEPVWFAVAFGKGKYDKMFFYAGEYRLPSSMRSLRREPGFENFMKMFCPDVEMPY